MVEPPTWCISKWQEWCIDLEWLSGAVYRVVPQEAAHQWRDVSCRMVSWLRPHSSCVRYIWWSKSEVEGGRPGDALVLMPERRTAHGDALLHFSSDLQKPSEEVLTGGLHHWCRGKGRKYEPWNEHNKGWEIMSLCAESNTTGQGAENVATSTWQGHCLGICWGFYFLIKTSQRPGYLDYKSRERNFCLITA